MDLRYSIFMVTSTLDESVKGVIRSAFPGDQVVLPPDGSHGFNYIYVRSGFESGSMVKLKKLVKMVDLRQTISKREVFEFVGRMADSESFSDGSQVKVRGFGNMVFTVVNSGQDSIRVECKLRNKVIDLEVGRKDVFRHKDPAKFVHTITDPNSDQQRFLVVDWDYVRSGKWGEFPEATECFDFCLPVVGQSKREVTVNDFVNLLVRIKLQLSGYGICVSFGREVSEEALDVVESLGLHYNLGGILNGDALFSDKSFLSRMFEHVCRFDQSGQIVVWEVEDVGDCYRDDLFEYVKYLRSIGVIKEAVFMDRIRSVIDREGMDGLIKVLPGYASHLSKFNEVRLVEVESARGFEVEEDRLFDFLNRYDLQWFVKNYDFYMSTLKG